MSFLGKIQCLKKSSILMHLVVAVLIVIGIFFVSSACSVGDNQVVRQLYKKQIFWAIAGILSYCFFAACDYRHLAKMGWFIYVASLALLVLVLLIGMKMHGSQRWLVLPLGITLQPSEIAKLSMIILMARLLSVPDMDMDSLKTFAFLLVVICVPFSLILVQPDLGTAMILLPTVFIMMFSAGVSIRYLGIIALLGVVSVGLMLGALVLPAKLGYSKAKQAKIASYTGLKDHQLKRIMVFLDSDTDPTGAGWNKIQSEIAVGSGGFRGKGFRNGTQNILGFLPSSVAPTDFIYSVIAEEEGFVGSVTIIILFAIIIIIGGITAIRSKDKIGRLLCMGGVSMLFCHVFINIGMTIGLMPITGLPLPLLSYGGSFMMVTMSALGIIQSVYIRCQRVDLFK